MKGISTVIATILMLAITIALAGTAYLYISGALTGKISTSFSLVYSYTNTVSIRNDGIVPISSFTKVTVDGNPASYSVSAQDSSLVGYWKFDEGSGTTAGDSSGKGNAGTLSGTGNVVLNPGFEDGNGADANNWIEGPIFRRDSTRAHSGQWSFLSGGTTSATQVITVPSAANNYTLVGWIYKATGSTGFAYLDLNDVSWECSAVSSVFDQWQFVSCNFNKPVGITSITVRAVTDGPFTGSAWFDDIVVTSGPLWSGGKYGNALIFDGVNDYVNAGNDASLNITGNMSVSWWFKADSLPPSSGGWPSQFRAFVRLGDNSPYALYLYTDGTGTRILDSHMLQDSTWNGVLSSPVLTRNQWYHIVWVHSGFDNILYVNGIYDNRWTQSLASRTSPGQGLYIGSQTGTAVYFNGTIDEVKIYNRALTADEISAIYTSNFGDIILPGSIADIKILSPLSTGTHTVRLCTPSMCNTAYINII